MPRGMGYGKKVKVSSTAKKKPAKKKAAKKKK